MSKTENEELNPGKIFETCFAFAPSRILLSGVELEVFTHITNGNNTSAEIANAANADPRGMEILLNSLTSLDFLTKSNGTYGLTPMSEKFLVKGIPSYYGDFVSNVDMQWEPWRDLTNVVKTGKPSTPIEREDGEAFFQKLVSQIFPMSYPAAKAAAEILGMKKANILDVAAGSGAWGIAFAQHDFNTKVTSQDWPGVLQVTKKFVNKFGLDDRFNYISGDLRKVDFGKGYDLIILGHICHSEGAENTVNLLSRCYNSLKSGGKLLIADMIPDDERCSTVFPLLFAVNMLVSTTEGNTFTMKEYNEWLEDAGYHGIKVLDVQGPSPLIVAIK
jgi:2-polyprenyl-3-methyl-5-hydroxy-6-metoxy-1,4-benzoquinol methylase